MRNRKKHKKPPYLMLLVMMLGLCLLIGGIVVYAAGMIREEKNNLFQIGNLESKIDEVFDEPETVQPNQMIKKEVTFTNTGTLTQFIRVMVQPSIKVNVAGETVERVLPSRVGQEIILEPSSYWKLGEDGYFYYLNALASQEKTEMLFSEVGLAATLPKEYQNGKFSLLLKVESVSNGALGYRAVWWSGKVPENGELHEIDLTLATKIDND
ncbi:hypothetical protein I6N95_17335 [Vagococcus sp. BWB3-3]|uniref:Uncharacterized protein n=1 Tax=Vagococcus allomyrinae TaxID=2794353 RepID=A0A940P6Y6_9ENTE|nr:hypothetical protein [Vagococcus allomyrinae]MBP1042784.1 hypothetical protein [Vagococcus allomyrinae]